VNFRVKSYLNELFVPSKEGIQTNKK